MFPLYSQKCQSIIVKPWQRLFQDQIQSTSSHGVQHPWLCNRAPATSATRGPCCDAWLVGKGLNRNENHWTNMKTIWWNLWSKFATLCANDSGATIISGRRHDSGTHPKCRIFGNLCNKLEPIKNKHEKRVRLPWYWSSSLLSLVSLCLWCQFLSHTWI